MLLVLHYVVYFTLCSAFCIMWFRVYYVPVLSVDDVVNFILCCTARRSLTRETENDEEGRVM